MLEDLAEHTGPVTFSSNGQILASGGSDRCVRLWDIHGHTNEVLSIAFSPDGKNLVSRSQDKKIKVWEITTGECLKTLRAKAVSKVNITGTRVNRNTNKESEDFGSYRLSLAIVLKTEKEGYCNYICTKVLATNNC